MFDEERFLEIENNMTYFNYQFLIRLQCLPIPIRNSFMQFYVKCKYTYIVHLNHNLFKYLGEFTQQLNLLIVIIFFLLSWIALKYFAILFKLFHRKK